MKSWNADQAAWQISKDFRFVYDGWNLIEERDALNGNSVVRKHVWGPDLSGTMQGAGGVGGLLWTTTPTQTFAASSDANGNIVAWINTATLAVAGRADYSPFGEPAVQTGIAKELPFGFSAKYLDSETGLLYYGFRYYNPSTGRFLNRDPINEPGLMLVRGETEHNWGEELNLYAMVRNDPVNRFDFLGLQGSPSFGLCYVNCMLFMKGVCAKATIGYKACMVAAVVACANKCQLDCNRDKRCFEQICELVGTEISGFTARCHYDCIGNRVTTTDGVVVGSFPNPPRVFCPPRIIRIMHYDPNTDQIGMGCPRGAQF